MKRILIFLLISFQVVLLRAQSEMKFKVQPIVNWDRASFFYINELGQNTLLLSNWKVFQSNVVDSVFYRQPSFYVDSFMNRNIRLGSNRGIITSDGNGNFFRLNQNKLYYYNEKTGKEKCIFRLNRKYMGVKYCYYEDFYNPVEGLSFRYNSQHNSVFFQVEPDMPYNRPETYYNGYKLGKLVFEVSANGKLIATYGDYASIYVYSYKKPAAINYYNYIDTLSQLIISQKASPLIQVFNTNTKTGKQILLDTTNMYGRFARYDSLSVNKSIEYKMKTLIESPAIGAVTFSSQLKSYLVLRTDSISDTTWESTSNSNFFKKQEFKKQKRGRYCPVWSNQFWKQMALYGNKRVYLQVYDADFKFVKEIVTPFPNRVQFLSEHPGEILLYSPNKSGVVYKIIF